MTDARLVTAETLAAAMKQLRHDKVSPEMRREGGWTMLTEHDATAILAALPPDPRLAALLAAAREAYEQASDPFPEDWIDDESSMAMGVTVTGRMLAALRDALAAFEEPV